MEQDKVRENHRFDPINSSNFDPIPATLAKPVRSNPSRTPGRSWVCWFCCVSLVVVFDCWRRVFGEEDCLIFSLFSLVVVFSSLFSFLLWVPKSSLNGPISIWWKTSLMDSNLAFQNRVYYAWDVSFLNSFENVLTNEIDWKLVLFWKKKNALFSQNQISDRTICSNSLRYKNRTAFIFFLLLLLLLFFFSFRVKGDCFIIFDILLIEIRSSRLFYVFGNVGVRVFDCLNRDFGYEGLVEGKQIWEIDVN